MDSLENMHDFNIPSIEHDTIMAVEASGPNIDAPAEESKNEDSQAVQATDSEALSSLLMLSKSNTDSGPTKAYTNEV